MMGAHPSDSVAMPGQQLGRPARPVGGLDRRQWLIGVAATGGLTQAARSQGADHAGHHHLPHPEQPATAPVLTRPREGRYQVPAVTLLDQQGRKVALNAALDDGRPVILNFIFTSCATVCPVMTHILVQVQDRLGNAAHSLQMASVSIDPEYDTPQRLLAYARRHGTGPQWAFYTGSSEASVRVQKAFDVFRGDKMNHEPAVLMRGRPGAPWLRLDGFASAASIIEAYRSATA